MRRLLLLLVSAGLVFGVVATASSMPILNSGIWLGNNHEYAVVSYPYESWSAARSEAQSYGYDLATVTGSWEHAFIESLLTELSGEYWLGAYQEAGVTPPTDGWQWVTGEEFNYQPWDSGEPNDAYGAASEQHLAMWPSSSIFGWRWNDEGNLNNITGYIAERTASVPEPATLFLLGSGLVGVAVFGRRRFNKT